MCSLTIECVLEYVFLLLKDAQVYNTATRVHVELTVDDQKIRAAASITNKKRKMTLERLEKILGISEIVSTTNMHLFDANMSMKVFLECVLLLQNASSYYRMYSLTVECVLLLTTNMHLFDAHKSMKVLLL